MSWSNLIRRAAPILIARHRRTLTAACVLGLALTGALASLPAADVRWTLMYRDTFDREAPPVREREGTGLGSGLELLWQRSLDEGVQDDGRATFSRFWLEWGEGRTEHALVPASTSPDPRLVRLREWRGPDLYEAIARAHERLLQRAGRLGGAQEAERILDEAGRAATREELVERLRGL